MSATLQTPDTALSDADLLDRTAAAVREAGSALRERFGEVVRYESREELMGALAANDDTALGILRPRLTALRPDAGWVEDELDGGALPSGEWWVVDPAEGNVNHLHALPEWAVTATLHLTNVAAGRIDAFWQFAGARADLLPGALLVTEAGGRITDTEGRPWTPQSAGFLAAAPGVHATAVATLTR
ncbi:inositol monophosphatase family protein [Streptomyces sp. NPDC004667]|uniref:inositol monophosphatase family protein n=1 Tax=Streptomyces sp. NPDC004667 TaxID=3154285 RepID=UPI0033A6CE92